MCRLHGKFASYLRRVLCKTRLIFPRINGPNVVKIRNSFATMLGYVKTGNKKRATCLARLLRNELNSDVERFTTHIKPVLEQIRLLTGLNMGGKTRNIAIQLVLQQSCKTSCTFFVARFPVPLERSVPLKIVVVNCSRPSNIAFRQP